MLTVRTVPKALEASKAPLVQTERKVNEAHKARLVPMAKTARRQQYLSALLQRAHPAPLQASLMLAHLTRLFLISPSRAVLLVSKAPKATPAKRALTARKVSEARKARLAKMGRKAPKANGGRRASKGLKAPLVLMAKARISMPWMLVIPAPRLI